MSNDIPREMGETYRFVVSICCLDFNRVCSGGEYTCIVSRSVSSNHTRSEKLTHWSQKGNASSLSLPTPESVFF